MKKKIFSILFALVLAVSLMLVPATVSANPGGGVLWGVTGAWDGTGPYPGRSEVFKVYTGTGAVTMVNNSKLNPLYGDIAMTPNGNLYASGADNNIKAPNGGWVINFNDFYRLDPVTGDVVQKWSNVFTDAGFHRVNALAAESNTSLLAIEGGGVNTGWGYPTGPRLLRITLDATGNFVSVTNVGTLMDKCSDGDLDRDPTTGKWYGGFWESAGSAMWEINVANPGASIRISQSNIKWQGGFAFGPDGTAYAGSWADKKLYTVNVLAGGSSVAYDLSAQLTGTIYGLSKSHLEVEIDIKPGSYPNSINPKSKGVIPVAILTTPDFDATTVDWTTVRFGKTGNEAEPAHDLSDPEVLVEHQYDVDGDGDTDFVFHFKTEDTGIGTGDTSATLTGFTNTGWFIVGTDTVRIVGK